MTGFGFLLDGFVKRHKNIGWDKMVKTEMMQGVGARIFEWPKETVLSQLPGTPFSFDKLSLFFESN